VEGVIMTIMTTKRIKKTLRPPPIVEEEAEGTAETKAGG